MQALLTVVVGAPPVVGQWPQGSVLVIDAQPSRLAALNSGPRQGVDLVCEAAVLAEDVGQSVLWYRYNDSRLDGVVPASQWLPLYPNAEELEQQSLRGERLDALLERWAVARDQRCGFPLALTLRQGDPLAALAGLGAWEAGLQQVELVSPNAEQLWRAAVAAWLEARGFERVPDQPLVWSRDLLARCRQACEALASERDDLQDRVAALEGRLTQINQELDVILASLDANDVMSDAEEPAEPLS